MIGDSLDNDIKEPITKTWFNFNYIWIHRDVNNDCSVDKIN